VSSEELNRIRGIAEYQYGHGAGLILFPNDIRLIHSRNTGRIRHIELNGDLLATFRPNDGVLTLTIPAAQRLVDALPDIGYTVTVIDEVVEFIAEGRNVFAKHVVASSEKIRPGDEVFVLSSLKKVLAIGKALLTKEEMLSFKTGVAVKTRRGVED
jgi:uncharacterized protein with predicted RNA binding PUA domain